VTRGFAYRVRKSDLLQDISCELSELATILAVLIPDPVLGVFAVRSPAKCSTPERVVGVKLHGVLWAAAKLDRSIISVLLYPYMHYYVYNPGYGQQCGR